ncbi:peptidyl-prolyl cis-trans isomerase CYP26-2, chloroplastic-like [Chenopodium quinoa]|uniref:peptidyl-prolyl cis-trans isomerase CYP26-2, chloroplastic-like n=1 Tax=Chenopodium quinoa TaxID=63459 RepID=UPI000B796710|nr:peptidyl-prolyl cis-trans isomerase CYP26-2, chloroplastic-like [Chenopodium quinoa]
MLQHLKLGQSPAQILHTRKSPYIPENQSVNASLSPLISKQCNKFSRRELTIFTNSSLLLLTSQTLHSHPFLDARAEEIPQQLKAEVEQQEPEATPTAEEVPQQNKGEVEQQEPEATPTTEEIPQQNKGEVEQQEPEATPTAEEIPQQNKGEAEQQEAESTPNKTSQSTKVNPTKQVFLDVSIDGKPTGRIIIKLYEQNAPVGAATFRDIVSGKAGISYRRKEFVKIMPNYVQHGGIRSYGVDAELASRTGRSFKNDKLVEELERENEERPGTKNLAGTVSIIVRDPLKPPPKVKLVAREGKLKIDQEEVGVEPNGTEFTIATKDSPELDSSALVIGKVIEGMDIVEKIGQVKTVQENTSSPYFRVAKLIGDKRAVVAERGFNRPYSKVIIMNCGLLE